MRFSAPQAAIIRTPARASLAIAEAFASAWGKKRSV